MNNGRLRFGVQSQICTILQKVSLQLLRLVGTAPEAPADPGESDQTEPETPVPSTPLNPVEKLEEKVIVEIVPEEPAEPVVTSGDQIIIPDEEVPLADTPKTGDVSGLWAALNFLPLGGLAMLKKKKRK